MTLREKLELAVQDTKDILDDCGIEYGPVDNVDINFRAKSRWGQCTFHRDTKSYSIEVSSMLFMEGVEWEALLDTLIHEFLHAHKDRMCHTGEWKRCANIVNREYPQYNIKRTTSAAEKNIPEAVVSESIKYIITCDGCGTQSRYKKKGRVVSLIMKHPKRSCCRCNMCGGNSFTVKEL